MDFLKNVLSEAKLKALTDLLGSELVAQINTKAAGFVINPAEEKLIPKSVFDEINNQLKDSKGLVTARDAQIAELGKFKGNSEELTRQIETLKTQNATAKAEYDAKLAARDRADTIEKHLSEPNIGAKDLIAVKAHLKDFLDKAELKDGKVQGLDDQIKTLKDSHAYLFNTPDNSKNKLGKNPNEPNKTPNSTEDNFAKFRKIS